MSDWHIDAAVAEYRDLGDAGFRRAHPHPVLLCRAAGDEDEASFHTAFMSRDALFETMSMSDGAGPEPSAESLEGRLFPVRKRQGGPFADRIGVGRARNADVSLPLPRVSKYHAYFSRDEGSGGYLLTDAGSKNGTSIDDAPLDARVSRAVSDGAEVHFGPYVFLFFTADGFARMVARRAREG